MAIGIAKMSCRGQIVIPQDMRKNFAEGDKVFIIEDGNNLILSKESNVERQIIEDMEFTRRTEEALERVENGEFISVDSKDLSKEMAKW